MYAGLKVIEVEESQGFIIPNYEGKAQGCNRGLRTNDFVYLHIRSQRRSRHEGDIWKLKQSISRLSCGAANFRKLPAGTEPVTIAILPDHPTPCAIKTHTNKPVPFVIYRTNEAGDAVQQYDEFACEKEVMKLAQGMEFMQTLIKPLPSKGNKEYLFGVLRWISEILKENILTQFPLQG